MSGISLETDGRSWSGTFANAVLATAKDLLTDGQPVRVRMRVNDEPVGGYLTAVAADCLVVSGRKIPVDEVSGFYVD